MSSSFIPDFNISYKNIFLLSRDAGFGGLKLQNTKFINFKIIHKALIKR